MSKATFTILGILMCGAALPAWYTDENEFLAVTAPGFYIEDFDSFQYGVNLNGSQTTWSAPGANGFGWDASAALGLWSLDGAISTSESEDTLSLAFTGSPVTAFGGVFFATDSAGFIVPQVDITVLLSNNETRTFTSDGLDFLGWTGGAPILGVELSVAENSATWISADHVYTGAMVPEPSCMLALGIGIAALKLRRRR